MRRKNSRPQWAKRLTASEWKHLQEGQARKVPTMRGLVENSNTCSECHRIFLKVCAEIKAANR